jgi:predicted ATPase
MTKADQNVESAADKLERVREAQRTRGVKAKVSEAGPQLVRPKQKKGGGLNPWVVVGAAGAGGYLLAKLVDWRGRV